jgi:hypothetical protein
MIHNLTGWGSLVNAGNPILSVDRVLRGPNL